MRVVESRLVELAALAAELELDARARDLHVAIAQRREAERIVRLRVALVADAKARRFEEAHEGGEHLLARQARALQVLGDATAYRRQCARELHHVVELVRVALLAPAL